MSDELKPCALCGSDKVEMDAGDESVCIRCRNCSMQSGRVYFTNAKRESDDFSASESEAIAAWNRRMSIPSAEIDTSEKRVDQARAQAFEEAAAICDAIKDQKNEFGARTKNHYGPTIASGAMLAATAIRALAAKDAK